MRRPRPSSSQEPQAVPRRLPQPNGFHEDVTVGIGQRLVEEMRPQWLRIGGYWYPRGGIPIDVFWQSGPPPEGLWIPDQGVASYRGAARSADRRLPPGRCRRPATGGTPARPLVQT